MKKNLKIALVTTLSMVMLVGCGSMKKQEDSATVVSDANEQQQIMSTIDSATFTNIEDFTIEFTASVKVSVATLNLSGNLVTQDLGKDGANVQFYAHLDNLSPQDVVRGSVVENQMNIQTENLTVIGIQVVKETSSSKDLDFDISDATLPQQPKFISSIGIELSDLDSIKKSETSSNNSYFLVLKKEVIEEQINKAGALNGDISISDDAVLGFILSKQNEIEGFTLTINFKFQNFDCTAYIEAQVK
ncbi:MAG: hypothetical protein WC123_03845 [Bacilli bacterium]|nr:hypothetical protein [Bacilli bacterium]